MKSAEIKIARGPDRAPGDATAPGTKEPGRRDVPSLTGLRFFAAFFVMYAHTTTMMGVNPNSGFGITANVANLGMTLFFVLSGFVIQWNYGAMTRQGWQGVYQFCVARFARLYPLYLLFLIWFIGVSPAGGDGHYLLSVVTYLTLTQSWFPIIITSGVPLSHIYLANAWSISTEVALYLAFIPASILLLRITERLYVLALIFIWVAATCAMIVVAWRYALVTPDFFPGWPGWLVYTSPYWRVMEFGIGVLVAKLVEAPNAKPANLTGHMLGFAGLLLLPLPWLAQAYLPLGGIATVLGFAPALGLIIYYLATYGTVFSRLLGLPVLIIFGEASYSIYFLHPWLIPMFNTPTSSAWLFVYKQCAIWMMSIVLSIGLYEIFERPMRTFIRARLGRNRSQPTLAKPRHSDTTRKL